MAKSDRYTLCGHNGADYSIVLREDILVGDDPNVHSRLYITNLYPRNQEEWNWLRGGDLLYASGILFALTDVKYMSVCEGPDVRRTIEDEVRKRIPNYFYYDKFILGPARSVDHDFSFEPWKHDEYSEYDRVERLLYVPNRPVSSIMGCWLWEKQY